MTTALMLIASACYLASIPAGRYRIPLLLVGLVANLLALPIIWQAS